MLIAMSMRTVIRPVFAGIIALVAFGIYAASNAVGAFPGESAAVMARALGASPFPPLSQPLWEALSRGIGGWAPHASVLAILSLLCALLAAASVGLAFSIAWLLTEQRGIGRAMESRRSESSSRREVPLVICVSGALWASMLLMLNMPVLIAATRPMPAAFDLWLLMFTLHRLARASLSGRRMDHWLGALCMGLLIVENPASLPIMAVVGVWMAWVVIQQDRVAIPGITKSGQRGLNISFLLVSAALLALGALAPLLVKAAWMRSIPAGAWLGYDSWGRTIWDLVAAGYRQYETAWPSQGWLIMALATAGPAALIAFVANGADRKPVARTLALLSLPVGVAGVLAFNSPVTPWMLFGTVPTSIWPGAILSLWGGVLGALWTRFAWLKWKTRERRFPAPSTPIPMVWKWIVAWSVPMALLSAAVMGTIREWAQVNTRGAAVLREVATSIVKDVPPRSWIISSGWLDDLMALSAYEQKMSIQTLDLMKIHQAPVRRFLEDHWKSNSLVSGLARFNIGSALLEWLHQEGHACAAILDTPDLWSQAGLYATPETWMYSGVPAHPTPVQIKSLSASAWLKMRAIQPLVERLKGLQPPVDIYGRVLRLLLSRIANDHGVQMISAGDPQRAREWLELSQSICPENDIPSWNIILLSASEGMRGELAEQLMGIMNEKDAAQRGFLANGGWLSSHFSSVKFGAPSPERPATTPVLTPAQRLDLALQAGVTHDQVTLTEFLASRQYADEAVLAASDVIQRITAGQYPEAQKALDDLNKRYPTDPICKLTELLMRAMCQQVDASVRLEAELEAQKISLPASVSSALAFMEIRQGMMDKATTRLEEAIRANPAYIPAMEMRLMLAVQQADRPEADRWAERLIGLDRGHPGALQVMAMIMVERKQWKEAEGLLRKALERESKPDLLNDLAWVLAVSGRASEAEPLIRKAISSSAPNANFVDTLVEVLQQMGRKADAAKALDDGLRQWPSDPKLLMRKSEKTN